MPLDVDDNYRGPAASHVDPHRKLGKHRTVITAALDLVEWLVDEDDVTVVRFGKMVTAAAQMFTKRAALRVNGRKIHLLLVATTAAQNFVVVTKSPSLAEEYAEEIKRRW